jgi:hypothetical protein
MTTPAQRVDTLAFPGLITAFADIADRLRMPEEERAGIAGLPLGVWTELAHGSVLIPSAVEARCVRRLRYSLPLLHRMLQNTAGHPPPAAGRSSGGRDDGLSDRGPRDGGLRDYVAAWRS